MPSGEADQVGDLSEQSVGAAGRDSIVSAGDPYLKPSIDGSIGRADPKTHVAIDPFRSDGSEIACPAEWICIHEKGILLGELRCASRHEKSLLHFDC